MSRYRILSLDGGGIKGLFTATLLERLQASYPALVERVDLIAGTSTGGILACGLAAGFSPRELGDLYRAHGAEIFDDSWLDNLVDLGNAVGAQYSQKNLERELVKRFGKRTLGELGKRVLIPAFDLDAAAEGGRPRMWKPKFFHNFPGSDSDRAETVVDVVLRTSAAPSYFPSWQGYVDGGVVANNPSMVAVAQALDRRGGKRKLDELLVLSVGTGTEPKFIAGRKHDWGWGQCARPLMSLMIGGTMGVADFQCRQILAERYCRLDRIFNRAVDLDDAREATLRYLVAEAQAAPLEPTLAWLEAQGW